MFDILSYSEKNDVEVSVRPGHDGRAVWEVFLRDRNLGLTEFSRIIDIELNGKPDRDAYIASRCEEMMEKIRSKRKEISAGNGAAGEAGGSFFLCIGRQIKVINICVRICYNYICQNIQQKGKKYVQRLWTRLIHRRDISRGSIYEA